MHKLTGLFLLLLGLSIFSCTKEGKVIYVEDVERDSFPIVYFLSGEGDMGDFGYVNAIYTGIVRGTNEGNMKLSINELPSDSTQAVAKLRFLLNQLKAENTSGKKLLIIANDNFESLLHTCEDDIKQAEGVDILLTETNDTTLPVYTCRMPQYGIYYQAGRVICEHILRRTGQIVIVNANPNDIPIKGMRDGFAQAVIDYVAEIPGSDIEVKNIFLSETTGGYHIPDSTYRLSYKISGCNYVLPLCGESAQGFLRYSRENSLDFSVIGVDYDMSNYCYAIPLSVIKHIDKVTEQWILKWGEGKQIERHQSFGLDSGYSEIVGSQLYSETPELAKKYYQMALEKEKAYENK